MKITMTLGNLQLTVNSVAEMTEDQAVAFMMRIAREVQVTPPVAPPAEKPSSDEAGRILTLLHNGPNRHKTIDLLVAAIGCSTTQAAELVYGPLPARIGTIFPVRKAEKLIRDLVDSGAVVRWEFTDSVSAT